MIRRKAKLTYGTTTPPSVKDGWILGWWIDQDTQDPFVLWEDGQDKSISPAKLGYTADAVFTFEDGQPEVLPLID